MADDDLQFHPNLDKMIDSIGDQMEEARWRIGIDDELIKLAGLSHQQVHALELHQLYSADLSNDDKAHLKDAIERILLAVQLQKRAIAELRRKAEVKTSAKTDDKITLLVFGLIILGLVGVTQFSGMNITVEPGSPSVMAIESSWWGLKEKRREIRWVQPRGYDAPAWMTKDSSGEWYPYLVEDMRPDVDYEPTYP